ncbi:LCP family protein [Desulfofundulus sp. TPOSR]|nr:LCP family protein [Desulfofundulus sp. TPOSR]
MVRRRRRWKPKPLFLLLLLLCLVGGGYLLAGHLGLSWPELPVGSENNEAQASQPPESFTVLLLGTDARPGEKVGRTDSIIVANVDGEKKRIALLSIPRDTRVDIPGHGTDKINAAAVYGGPALTCETVSNLIGMPVQYYALARWEGFKNIVDVLGGVTIDVERNMYHYDSSDGRQYAINLRKGVQRLDGDKALQYVRFRGDALGDIGRTERQLKFLKALAAEVMKPSTLVKLPRLVPEINKSVETNMGFKQMLALARAARYFDQAEIVTQTLPGRFLDIRGVSYWSVDPAQAHEVAMALFEEGRVTEVVQGPTVSEGKSSSGPPARRTGTGQLAAGEPVVTPSQPPPPAVPPVLPGPETNSPGSEPAPGDGSSTGAPAGSTPGQDNAPPPADQPGNGGGTGDGSSSPLPEKQKPSVPNAGKQSGDTGGVIEIIPIPNGSTS